MLRPPGSVGTPWRTPAATRQRPPLLSRLRPHQPRAAQPARQLVRGQRRAVAGDERRGVGVVRRGRARARSARQRSASGPAGQVGDAQRRDGAASSPPASSASHTPPWRASSALRRNSSRSASSSPRRLARERVGEAAAARHRGVDLGGGVVVVQHDRTSPTPGTGATRVAGVGDHEEREVRRALGRGQAQAHLDVARPAATAHEPTKPSVVIGSSSSGSKTAPSAVQHAAPAGSSRGALHQLGVVLSRPASPASSGSCSSAGTSMP